MFMSSWSASLGTQRSWVQLNQSGAYQTISWVTSSPSLTVFCNCVRRRRTHTNRVVLTEITLEGFMDQSLGDRLWYHVISGIGRNFGPADWLAGYVAQIASISCANVFLAALSWRHRFFFSAQSVQWKNLLLKIERTLLIFDYC